MSGSCRDGGRRPRRDCHAADQRDTNRGHDHRVVAGLLGLEHGYVETLQGNAAPSAALISVIGPPCQPETAWHACEPAFTLVPSFFVIGLLAMISFACDTRTEAETR